MRKAPLFIHKIYKLLAKSGRHILYTWPLFIRPTQENKILTITTLYNWPTNFLHDWPTNYLLYDFCTFGFFQPTQDDKNKKTLYFIHMADIQPTIITFFFYMHKHFQTGQNSLQHKMTSALVFKII